MPNKKSPKRTPKRSPRKRKIANKTVYEQLGGKPIVFPKIISDIFTKSLSIPFINRELRFANLTTRINYLFGKIPINSKTKELIKSEINKYHKLVENLYKEYNEYQNDKTKKKGVKALYCFNERSYDCLNESCDVPNCTNRYSKNLFELTGGELNGGIKRCFDHWQITTAMALANWLHENAKWYYQRRISSIIMGSQEIQFWNDHAYDEIKSSTIIWLLQTSAEQIIHKLMKPKISNAGKKILRDRAKKAAKAKKAAEAKMSKKRISSKKSQRRKR